MTVLICPGIHSPQLTEAFIASLLGEKTEKTKDFPNNWLVFPSQKSPPYFPLSVLTFLDQHVSLNEKKSILFIGFSAGVVGTAGAALRWQMQSVGGVKGLIAIDGWGVPLGGNFPIHRISHDYFTHWSSALLGGSAHREEPRSPLKVFPSCQSLTPRGGGDSFYAEPGVEHQELWRSPHLAWGWRVKARGLKQRCSATAFLRELLKEYEEI